MKIGFIILLGVIWMLSVVISSRVSSTLTELDMAFKPIVYSDHLYSKAYENDLYLKKRVRGLLGDHSRIFLTTNSERERPDENEDVIIENVETIFYQVKSDTLVLFSRNRIDDINKLKTNMVIINTVLTNPEFMNKYDAYHQSLKCTDWM